MLEYSYERNYTTAGSLRFVSPFILRNVQKGIWNFLQLFLNRVIKAM